MPLLGFCIPVKLGSGKFTTYSSTFSRSAVGHEIQNKIASKSVQKNGCDPQQMQLWRPPRTQKTLALFPRCRLRGSRGTSTGSLLRGLCLFHPTVCNFLWRARKDAWYCSHVRVYLFSRGEGFRAGLTLPRRPPPRADRGRGARAAPRVYASGAGLQKKKKGN